MTIYGSQEYQSILTSIDKKTLCWMYQKLTLIRAFEERLHQDILEGKLPGFAHLYVGQEAVAVGICAHLNDDDYVTSTHRGHGHCIAKNVDVKRLKAELMGKVTGICEGKGGSLHVADFSRGFLGANSIVGSGLATACGAALSAKLRGTKQVAVGFCGDGATNQGCFHESLNLASIWNLPVVFVIENNLYADATPISYTTKNPVLADRAKVYGIPGKVVDGLDVFAVFQEAGKAIQRARESKGPSLLECRTYRYYGHYEGDPGTYRTEEELKDYKQRDCLRQFRSVVLECGAMTEDELNTIEQATQKTIADADVFAMESPLPRPEECLDDVLA